MQVRPWGLGQESKVRPSASQKDRTSAILEENGEKPPSIKRGRKIIPYSNFGRGRILLCKEKEDKRQEGGETRMIQKPIAALSKLTEEGGCCSHKGSWARFCLIASHLSS